MEYMRNVDYKEFIIWFSGFWEGEGSVYIHPKQNSFWIEVCQSIDGKNKSKTVKECFLMIKRRFGGHIYEYSNPCKIVRWRCYRKKTTKMICNEILPYLKIRKKEIKAILKVMNGKV